MFCYVGGVNGVGKTVILEAVVRMAPEWRIFHATEELIKWTGLKDREELRLRPQALNLRDYRALLDEYLPKHKSDKLIFDAHFFNLRHSKFSKVTGPFIGNMNKLVLIEADAETVLSRIEGDTRDRGLWSKGASSEAKARLLGEFIKREREEFELVARLYRKDSLVINRGTNDVEESARKFVAFVGS